MRKLAYTLIAVLAVAGALYAFGLGPFKEGTATGQQQRRGRRDSAVSVRIERVKVGNVEERLSYVGTLLANASVTVAPKIAGRVEKLFVDVGDAVKERQLLAQLDKGEWVQELKDAEASLKVSEATLKGKEAELADLKRKLERAKILLEKSLIAREEVDTLSTQVLAAEAQVELTKAQMSQMKARLENARLRLDDTDVLSPFDGFVGKRFVDRGALANPSTPLVSIVDIDPLKVVIAVVEKDYRKISPGQAAAVTTDAYPGRVFHGKVSRMAPVLNQETRTGDVEIELPNPRGNLKPGMFARVDIVAGQHQGVLLVPLGAQVKTPGGFGVFKVMGDGPRVALVSIEPGLSQEGWVEVRGGLEPGDRIVTVGSGLLKDGQTVRIVDGTESAPAKGGGRKKGRRP